MGELKCSEQKDCFRMGGGYLEGVIRLREEDGDV